MRRRAPLITALLTAGILLTGCAAPTPGPAGGETEPDAGGTTQPAPAAPQTPITPVNEADLPEWFPAELPMPAGEYRRTVPDDAGATLTFGISGEQVILDLVAELESAGFSITAVDDHGDGWKTWFTENAEYRANIAARDLGTTDAWIDYRIERR